MIRHTKSYVVYVSLLLLFIGLGCTPYAHAAKEDHVFTVQNDLPGDEAISIYWIMDSFRLDFAEPGKSKSNPISKDQVTEPAALGLIKFSNPHDLYVKFVSKEDADKTFPASTWNEKINFNQFDDKLDEMEEQCRCQLSIKEKIQIIRDLLDKP